MLQIYDRYSVAVDHETYARAGIIDMNAPDVGWTLGVLVEHLNKTQPSLAPFTIRGE